MTAVDNITYRIVNKDEFDLHEVTMAQQIGGTGSLTTSSKEVVSAINEINANKISKRELNDHKAETIGIVNALGDRIDTILVTPLEGVNKEEIIDARGGEVNLGARLNAIESVLRGVGELTNPFVINLTATTPVAEIGDTIDSNTFSWTYNYAVSSQIFDDEVLDTSVRAKPYNEQLSSDKVFTLVATSISGSTKSTSLNIKFCNGIYYGCSSAVRYDGDLIRSLSNKVLSDSRARSINVDAGEGEYIYYCIPSRLGSCIFTVGGFVGGFLKVSTITFTNSHGHTEDYTIYRSDNAGLGSLVASIT